MVHMSMLYIRVRVFSISDSDPQIQLPANGRAGEDQVGSHLPTTWFQAGPAPAIVDSWGLNQQMKPTLLHLSVSVSQTRKTRTRGLE